MRYATIRAIDDAGLDLRLWCFACGRGVDRDSIIWELFAERGWAIDIEAARRRFTCRHCRSSAAVMIFPATRPPQEEITSKQLVERYFHTMRSARKNGRPR